MPYSIEIQYYNSKKTKKLPQKKTHLSMGLKVSHLVTLSQVTRGLTRYRNTNLDKFVNKNKLDELFKDSILFFSF